MDIPLVEQVLTTLYAKIDYALKSENSYLGMPIENSVENLQEVFLTVKPNCIVI